MKLTVALLALTATPLVHADPASVVLTGLGMSAAAAAFTLTAAKAFVAFYGLYRAKRARNKARRAADGGIEDRRTTVGAPDMARSIVYGERQVDGRVVFVVEASEDQPGLQPGEEPKFYIVKALEPDHEIDSIVDLQFDGRPVGPFIGDPYSPAGAVVAPGSFYNKQAEGSAVYTGVVPEMGFISIPGRDVTMVQSLVVSDADFEDPERPDAPAPPIRSVPDENRVIDQGDVMIGPQYIGRHFRLTYLYEINEPLVRVWFYRGTQDQQANQKVILASGGSVAEEEPRSEPNAGGVWASTDTLRGTPYVVVEITPDFEKFPAMQPYITATVKGKRGLLVHGGSGWSQNPADHIYDYLITEIGARQDEINMDLLEAAHAVCAEQILSHYDDQKQVVGEGAANPLPNPVFEPRYACDAVLSTEVRMVDNLRYLLASMAGSSVYSGGQFDIRAGAPELPAGLLTDKDLGPGGVQIDPFTPALESFNAVRGRHTARKRIYTELGGITTGDHAYSYVTTDFPPYKSAFYIGQDQGEVNWEEIDLPCVRSEWQAQRIEKLLLHLNRNGLMLSAEWQMSAARFSPGQVVNVTIPAPGFFEKPFRIMSKSTDIGRGLVRMAMKEEPASVYDINYDEARDPDPAPNTILTPVDQVETPQNIRIDSGPGVARYGQDGHIVPVARITWDRPKGYGVLRGGQVEVWHKFGQYTDWQRQTLPGSTGQIEVPVQRDLEIAGQIRFINAAQVPGPFAHFSKRLDDVPTQYLTGNLLYNARYESFTQAQRPDTSYHDWLRYLPGWMGVVGSSPDGYPVAGVGDRKPVPLPIRKGDPSRPGTFDTGFLTWSDFKGENYPTQWVESLPIEIEAGSRVVAFAHCWGQFGQVSLSIVSYDIFGDYFREYESLRVTSNSGTGNDIADMTQIHVFARIPAFSGRPVTRVRLRLYHHRTPGFPDNFVTVAKFARPWLGYASEGQITLPPWAS